MQNHGNKEVDTYSLSTTGERYQVVEDTDTETYKVQYRQGRFGPLETLGEDYGQKRDAEQVLLGLFEIKGNHDLVDEVLEP